MRLRSLVLLGILLTLTAALAAQQHRESVTVEVVDVPVYVTRGATPVAGLTRDDFELYVNGKRQPIDYFDAAAADAPASLRERRLFLLLFDLAFSHPHSVSRAQKAAASAIAKGGARDYFAVATYSSRRGVWFAVPFTRDHAALTRAVANLSQTASGDPLSLVLTEAERTHSLPLAEEALRDIARAQTLRAAEDQVIDLGDLAERLAPLDGEKHVVLLTEGYDGPTIHPFDVRASLSGRGRGRELGEPMLNAFGGRSFDPALSNQILRVHQVFQRENVLLHAIDLEGVSHTIAGDDAVNFLVKGTGGHFIAGHNDLGVALSDLSGKLARGYRLGFRPTGVHSGYNSISVKLRQPRGMRVNHREGFFGTPRRGNTNDGVYLADILLNDVPQTGTAATLSLHDRTLTAKIPMRELAAQLPAAGSAELLLYAFDATGTAVLYHRHTVRVTDAETETVQVTVPEGTRVAKALLRVDGMLGFSRVGG